MMNLDISKNERMISHFQHVLRSRMSPRRIHHTEGRAWDGLCYILSGSCRYTFSDGTEFTATQGCLLYLAKDALYDMRVEEGPYESIFCDFLFDSDQPRQSMILYPKDGGETERRFRRLLQRFSLKTVGYRSECLSLLYRIYGTLQSGSAPQYLPSASLHRLEDARAYVLEHFADDTLSVKSLAERSVKPLICHGSVYSHILKLRREGNVKYSVMSSTVGIVEACSVNAENSGQPLKGDVVYQLIVASL